MASWMFYLYSIALICVIYVVSKLVEHVKVVRKIKEALDQLPSAKKHWFSGHAHLYSLKGEANLESIRECMAERPRIEAFWLGNWMVGTVRVWHPDTVKAILKSQEPKYVKYCTMKFGKDVFGDSLALSSGRKWIRNRALLNPVFHASLLQEYMAVKNERAKVLREKLLKYSKQDRSFEMHHDFSLLSMEILMRCAFSNNADLQSSEAMNPYMTAMVGVQDLWDTRISQPWVHSKWIYDLTTNGRKWARVIKIVHQYAEAIIAEKKKNLSEIKQAKNFLDILFSARDEDGNGLTDEEIRDEVNIFMIAGHETVSKSLSWLAYTLAENPIAQNRCQEEIDKLWEEKDEDDDILNEDLGKLPYLTMCLNESMRLHTTLPVLGRELSKPLTIDGVTFPVNTIILIYLYGLHHNPQVWDEPMKFKPERFLSENIEKRDPYSFLPFSGGPRNCIGKNFAMNEMKIIMATLLRKITFQVDTDRIPIHQPRITMKSENGFHLRIVQRG